MEITRKFHHANATANATATATANATANPHHGIVLKYIYIKKLEFLSKCIDKYKIYFEIKMEKQDKSFTTFLLSATGLANWFEPCVLIKASANVC